MTSLPEAGKSGIASPGGAASHGNARRFSGDSQKASGGAVLDGESNMPRLDSSHGPSAASKPALPPGEVPLF